MFLYRPQEAHTYLMLIVDREAKIVHFVVNGQLGDGCALPVESGFLLTNPRKAYIMVTR